MGVFRFDGDLAQHLPTYLQKRTAASEVPMSTNAASLEAPRDGALWVVQVLGAILLLISGLAKLSGVEQLIETFRAIGIGHMGMGQWFRYVTGLIEFTSAFALLIPALAGIGALLLVPIMIGAVLTQLLIIGGSPALPIGLLTIASVVAWGRKEQFSN
jgi:putative oxidoreductase